MATARKATAAKGKKSNSKALVIAKPLKSRTAKPLTVYGPGAEQGEFVVEWWPITRVKPYKHNPRKISELAVKKVAASLQRFGFQKPLVADEKDELLAGHTTLLAALSLGLTVVPVHPSLGLTSAEKRAYRIADNRTAQESKWDDDLLALELNDLELAKFDMHVLGWSPMELDHLLGRGDDFSPVGADEQGKLDEKKPVTCPHCGETFTL